MQPSVVSAGTEFIILKKEEWTKLLKDRLKWNERFMNYDFLIHMSIIRDFMIEIENVYCHHKAAKPHTRMSYDQVWVPSIPSSIPKKI